MWIVMTDQYPGYWGRGETEEEALVEVRKAGGRPSRTGTLRVRIADGYVDAYVDGMGTILASWSGDPEDPARPRHCDAEVWRVGPRGKRERLK